MKTPSTSGLLLACGMACASPENGTYYCVPLGEGNAPLLFSPTSVISANPDGSYGKPVDVSFDRRGKGTPVWTTLDNTLRFIFRENQIYIMDLGTETVLGKLVCE